MNIGFANSGIHSEDLAFTVKLDVTACLDMELRVQPGAVPTLDVANERNNNSCFVPLLPTHHGVYLICLPQN